MDDPRISQAKTLAAAERRRIVARMAAAIAAVALVTAVVAGIAGIRGALESSPVQTEYMATPDASESAGDTASQSTDSDANAASPDTVEPGVWVLVLESYPKDQYTLAQARELASAISWNVSVIDSSTTPGLNSGYWAVINGNYQSEDTARESCYVVDRTVGDKCYPRYVG